MGAVIETGLTFQASPSIHRPSHVVLHVARDPYTGVWSAIKSLCAAQARRGYDVHLGLLASRDWPYRNELESLPCKCHIVESPWLFGTAAFAYHSLRSPVAAWARMLRPNGAISVIHYHNGWLGGALCLADRGVRQVVTFHGICGDLHVKPIRRFIHRRWARRLLTCNCMLTSVDRPNCDRAEKVFGIPATTFSVVPNGYTAPEVRPERSRKSGPLIVGHAGVIDENKGWRITAEAVRILAREGINIRLRIAGNGPESADAEKWCAENSAFAEYLGYVPNAASALMPKLDVMVLASGNEGMPMSVIEAMASGAVVLCTPVGSLPEVVADGETGYLIGRSPELVANRLRDLAMNDTLRERMSKAARRVYCERFSGDAICAAYERIYDSAPIQ